MSSEGADTRKDEENLTLVESLIFRQFGLSSEAEYARFKAELRTELCRPESSQTAQNDAEDLNLPSNGGQEPDIKIEMLAEEEIKIEISPVTIEYDNDVVKIQHKPIDIKREVISIEDGPELPGNLPKSGFLSCGQCRTRSGDFQTMEELEAHIKEKHGRGQTEAQKSAQKLSFSAERSMISRTNEF